mmetsp:Transcript_40822/g.96696  ORF Transcript_40822/g.96696 Transcript_40822/m.96696 type:complete len:205 (-) Transcript_40822:303-917(-)
MTPSGSASVSFVWPKIRYLPENSLSCGTLIGVRYSLIAIRPSLFLVTIEVLDCGPKYASFSIHAYMPCDSYSASFSCSSERFFCTSPKSVRVVFDPSWSACAKPFLATQNCSISAVISERYLRERSDAQCLFFEFTRISNLIAQSTGSFRLSGSGECGWKNIWKSFSTSLPLERHVLSLTIRSFRVARAKMSARIPGASGSIPK